MNSDRGRQPIAADSTSFRDNLRSAAVIDTFGLIKSLLLRRWLRVAGAAVVMVTVVIVLRDPIQIQYHRAFVVQSRMAGDITPSKLNDYFSTRTMFWLVTGRPNRQQTIDRGTAHEQALIRLGYFERRTYPFPVVDSELAKEVQRSGVKDQLCFFRFDRSNGALQVTARPDDFKKIEPIIERRLQIQ